MATNLTGNNQLYGIGQGTFEVQRNAFVAQRSPSTSDKADIGQLWVNASNNTYYILTSFSGGSAIWTAQSANGGSQASLTLTGGSGTVLTVSPSGNTVLGGNLSVAGTSTLSGALTVNSGSAAISIGTDAVAKTITVGNATGATAVSVNVGTGALNLGTDATAHATTIGSTTSGSTLTLQTPTGIDVVAANGISITAADAGVSLPGGVLVISGAGSPSGTVTAPIGSLYLNTTAASATTRAYINTNNGTTWTNITCAA